MRFAEHVEKWKSCRRCLLCEGRQRVVLARGALPCDVLFVGEAPGQSENVHGVPFMGPAGQKLEDDIVKPAMPPGLESAFTNLVACFPADAKDTDNHEPPDVAIRTCQPRLAELIGMARPKLIVAVGTLARDWLDQKRRNSIKLPDCVKLIDIVHPAAILRAPLVQQTLMTRRCVVQLAQAVENL